MVDADDASEVVEVRQKQPFFLNQITMGHVLQTVPVIGILGVAIKTGLAITLWATAINTKLDATIVEMRNSIHLEQEARLSHEVQAKLEVGAAKMEVSGAVAALSAKVDNNQAINDQKLTNITDKLGDLRSSLAEVVKASTPSTVRTR